MFGPNAHSRRAAAIVFVAVVLTLLLMCGSLAIDVGHICAVAAEMQNNADAGALGGAMALRNGTPETAEATALEIIEQNQAPQGFLSVTDQIVETGIWSPKTGFISLAASGAGKAFAVRVVALRAKTQYFFAAIMGKHSADVSRPAVALGSEPCHGIWGLEGVKSGSINTDSYDSTIAPYSALTAAENGDICSGRDITAGGSFNVRGDVMPGFGYSLTVNGSSGEITGYTTNNSGALPTAPAFSTEAKYNNDNNTIPLTSNNRRPYRSAWNISLTSGENLTLGEGTYYFDSLKLTGGSRLTTTGAVTLYIAGNVDCTGGGIVNTTQSPHDLTIISSGAEFKLGGGGTFYGMLWAPKGVVTLGSNTVLYGAVVGRILELKGDATIHVDESLPPLMEAPPVSLVE